MTSLVTHEGLRDQSIDPMVVTDKAQFTKGQSVLWTTTRGGVQQDLLATVLSVIIPGRHPDRNQCLDLFPIGMDMGFPRLEHSYLLEIQPENGGEVWHAWPPVSRLSPINFLPGDRMKTSPMTSTESESSLKLDAPVFVMPKTKGKETKKGAIAAVVPPGTLPSLDDFKDLLSRGSRKLGKPRDTLSYVVKVLPNLRGRKTYHIWPLTKFIQPATETEEQEIVKDIPDTPMVDKVVETLVEQAIVSNDHPPRRPKAASYGIESLKSKELLESIQEETTGWIKQTFPVTDNTLNSEEQPLTRDILIKVAEILTPKGMKLVHYGDAEPLAELAMNYTRTMLLKIAEKLK